MRPAVSLQLCTVTYQSVEGKSFSCVPQSVYSYVQLRTSLLRVKVLVASRCQFTVMYSYVQLCTSLLRVKVSVASRGQFTVIRVAYLTLTVQGQTDFQNIICNISVLQTQTFIPLTIACAMPLSTCVSVHIIAQV